MPIAAATRVEIYDASCPANTPASAPIEVTLFGAGDFEVIGVTVVIPDGHAGTTGIALAMGHNRILPLNTGAYISGNDEEPYYALKGYPRGAPWTAFVCNTDAISHTWELRFEFDDTPTVAVPAVTASGLAPAAIYAAAGSPGP